MQGVPCKNGFVVTLDVPDMPKSKEDSALSPKGSYRAQTTIRDSANGTLNIVTAILSESSGQVVSTVNWRIFERLGELGLGGEWVTDSQFLIYETLDQGPLLIGAGKNVIQVAPELFKSSFVPSTDVSLRAIASVLPNTDTYHLVLFGVGTETEFPPIMLYHSETGAVEQLPFAHLWSPAFSPDGRWLLLDQRPMRDGYEHHSLWIRSLDPANSETRYLGEGDALWTDDWTKVAFGLKKSISVLTFPDGIQLSLWNVRQYDLYPRAWSPDGQFIAVEGYTGRWQQALFVINVVKQ